VTKAVKNPLLMQGAGFYFDISNTVLS
jgi:hypothetical protein